MARKCILCGSEYTYCKSCPKDIKKETWHTLYDTENCKNISQALTNYNLKQITKEDAREILSTCDLSIELNEHYRSEIEEIMSKPKRGQRAKALIIDEVIPEEIKEEIFEEIKEEAPVEEPIEVVVEE